MTTFLGSWPGGAAVAAAARAVGVAGTMEILVFSQLGNLGPRPFYNTQRPPKATGKRGLDNVTTTLTPRVS